MLVVTLAITGVPLHARSVADDVDAPGEEDAQTTAPSPVVPRPKEPPRDPNVLPDFMARKRRMRDADLQDKVEGGYFTGLPLANSDPDTGVGFGARAYYFNNGPRADKMFEYTPYRHRVFAQAFFTTNGYQFHTIDYDGPYLRDTPVRVRASVFFEKNIAANYFGVGARSMGRLAFPGAEGTFAKLSEYSDALRQLRDDGTAYTRYDQYILQRPVGAATIERDFFGGVVRGLVGFTASYVAIDQWTNESVLATDPATGNTDVGARSAPTRLQEDCNAGAVRGCSGGFNNALKLGIAFDTRDFEPDPNSGFFVDLTTEMAGRPIGSEFDWARATFSPRAYFSPFPKLTDLVIAGRLVGSIQTADTPFFALPDLSFTDWNRQGLGGLRTLRGFKQNRFIGRVVALANLEIRWTFVELNVTRRQHFALMAVPFLDVGRVFDSLDDIELRRFRNGQGLGLRIAWNQATIIVADYAISREGTSLYINFNHPF